MADRVWKSMPAALKRPTLDKLYRHLRALDYTQVDEKMTVMLNAILQMEEQGECRESATEAVLMVGYTTDGISNQEQTRWLSWNVDGGGRGFDLARNPGLSNNTEYGSGEFPLPTRPSARSAGKRTSKTPSMTRAQQTEEAYPHLSSLKRELERTQKERNKANLDRDQSKLERNQANLERDQAVIEKDQARRELDMLKAEHQQEQRVRENAANCEQLKSELERIQRRQRELDMQKGARPKERTAAGSRPESRMEVDEAPRSKGRFNLDRAAQEHMKEGLEVWIPTESTSSLHGLETQPIRPLKDVALPGYTPSSTPSGSQVSGSSSRLKELNERLQLRNRESPARVELPPTWREQPVRSVVIMERAAFPDDASSDGIHFDRPRGVEWLNDVFQMHISALEADLLETAQFTFGPPPNPPFLTSRTLSSRLGARVDSIDSSRSSRARLPGAAPMEAKEATSPTPQSSVVSSVVVVESKMVERPAETSRSRYLEKVKELDLEDLECRQELAEALGLERVSHEDLSRHQCVDWLKAHETHFSRARMMETGDLTRSPTRSVMGPINYIPLKLLGNPGLIVEPPKHRTSIARIRLATPAQLRVVEKPLDPREMELPDAAYEGTRLADDPRYGKPCGNAQLAKTLAVYDRADPAAARVIIVAGSDFEGSSPKLFWPETLIYSLPGAE